VSKYIKNGHSKLEKFREILKNPLFACPAAILEK
jgi:hypothetical protein